MSKKHQQHEKGDHESEIKNQAEAEKKETPIEASEAKRDWEKKAEEYLNDLKRCQADFENYKKRQIEAQKELGGYLIEKLVLDIVPVLDNFRQATEHVPKEEKESPWVTGIQYIEKQLEKVLEDNEMKTMEVKVGEAFDPKLHEAVDSQPSTGNAQQETAEGSEPVELKGHTIAKVLQNGYQVGGKVIRPARVIVS